MLGEHAELTEMTAASGQPVLSAISAALPDDAALIGYVRFERAPRPSAGDTSVRPEKDTQPAYAAFVLPVGRRDPVAVDLGSAEEIDRLVRTGRDEAGLGRNVPGRSAAAATEAYRRAGAALRARIWDPLAAHIASAGRIYVVPDGPLHLVNLAALPDDGERYLIDADRPLIYLTTERDLVRRQSSRPVAGSLLALGAPDFTDCLASVELEPLPASADEVAAITKLWRRSRPEASQDGAVLALFGRDASEAAFKRLAPHYRALHVATHGFYWAEDLGKPLAMLPGRAAPAGQAALRGVGGLLVADPPARGLDLAARLNPMLRSGLLLAGDPDRSLGSADGGAESAGDEGGEDGVLTAAEISVLDLRGVDWVVLSACESGVGMTQASEGVFGLRRAFRIAGARGLVISLWPLADDLARDWMLQLYSAHLADRLDLVPAAWQASRAILAARRTAGLDTHPHTWAGFIACGD
jgi:CHAT domain-containing protein